MFHEWTVARIVASSSFALLIAVSGSAVGQQSGTPRADTARNISTRPGSAPAVGNVDLAKSRAFIFVGKTGLGHDHGVEGQLSAGNINLGAKQQCGSLVFDMKSFDADTPTARKYVSLEGTTDASTRKKVNDNMKGSAVLDVERHPTARFDIQSAIPIEQRSSRGNPVYQLSGNFTLHGVARPIRFNAEAVAQQGATRLRGGFAIRQSDFGIKPFTKAFGAVGVADELKIYGDIVLVQRASVANTATNRNGEQR
ncbi:MAG: YceI family protein [Planctomycetales bacterium]|nr:YceI family protein [Planctomycetales bacterium]